MKRAALLITAVLILALGTCRTAPESSELELPPMPELQAIPAPPLSLIDAPAEEREWVIEVIEAYEAQARAWGLWAESVVWALLPYQLAAYLAADEPGSQEGRDEHWK